MPPECGIELAYNESAKYACIKGTSHSFSMQVLCRVMQQLEVEKPTSLWYERVASHSNPGDMPSRNQTDSAARIFNATSEAVWFPPANLVEAIIMLHQSPYGVVHTPLTGEQTSATNTNPGGNTPAVKKRASVSNHLIFKIFMQQISIHRIYIHIRICVLLYTAVSVKRITLKRTVNTFGGNGAWRRRLSRSDCPVSMFQRSRSKCISTNSALVLSRCSGFMVPR